MQIFIINVIEFTSISLFTVSSLCMIFVSDLYSTIMYDYGEKWYVLERSV